MSFSPILIWFLAGLALVLVEFVIPGVILVFFGLGAWITTVTTWLGWTDGVTSQLMTFAISSVVLLVFLRRRFRSRFFGYVGDDHGLDSNIDEFVGQTVKVTEAIEAGGNGGRVEFKGAAWTAYCETPLPAGSRAVIVEVKGINLTVRPE